MAQPIGCPAHFGGREVRDERVAGCASDALADAIDEPRTEHPRHGGGERKDRLRRGAEPIAEYHEQLTLAEVVRDRAGEHLRDGRRRLGGAFEDADGGHGRPEHRGEEDGQQAVDEFRGRVHEQRREPKRPYAPGEPRQAVRDAVLQLHRARTIYAWTRKARIVSSCGVLIRSGPQGVFAR